VLVREKQRVQASAFVTAGDLNARTARVRACNSVPRHWNQRNSPETRTVQLLHSSLILGLLTMLFQLQKLHTVKWY